MSEQPEALRLADALKRAVTQADQDDQVLDVPRWTVTDSATELRRQHAEIEALRADAERYRWLKSESMFSWWQEDFDSRPFAVIQGYRDALVAGDFSTIDEVINAAMKGQP